MSQQFLNQISGLDSQTLLSRHSESHSLSFNNINSLKTVMVLLMDLGGFFYKLKNDLLFVYSLSLKITNITQ